MSREYDHRSPRLEREIRLDPHGAGFDPERGRSHGLAHVGTHAWACVTTFIDSVDHRLGNADASLAVVLAPGVPTSLAWMVYKRLSTWAGGIREAYDQRSYFVDGEVPEVSELIAAQAPPVLAAVGSCGVAATDLSPTMTLAQRRVQHRFTLAGDESVVVSVDDVVVRYPWSMDRAAEFQMLELDVTNAPAITAATGWTLFEDLIDRGMSAVPFPKYQYSLRLLAEATDRGGRR